MLIKLMRCTNILQPKNPYMYWISVPFFQFTVTLYPQYSSHSLLCSLFNLMSTSWISIQATEEGNSQHANVDVVGNCEESSNQISIVVIKQSLIQIAKDIQQENTTIDNVILDKFKELQNHLSRRSFIDYNTSVEQQLEHDSLSFLTYKLKSDYLSQYIKYNNNILTEAYYSTLNACKSMHHTDLFDHSLLLRLATQALQTGDLQTSKHILSLQRLQDNSLPHVLQQLTNQLSQKAMTGSYESLDNYTWTSRSQNAASLSSELVTSVSKSNAEFMKFLLIAIFQLSRGRSFHNAIEDLTLCANSSDLAQHGSNSIVNDSVVETTAQEVNENIDTSAINITTEDVTANVPTPLVSVDVVSTRSRRKGIIAQSSRGGDDDAEESARPITSTVSAEGYTSRGIMLQQTILGILTSDEWCSHQQLSPSSSSNLRSHIASLSESEPVSSVVDNANDNDDNDDHNTPNRSEYNLNRLFRLTNNVFFKLKDDLQPPFSSFTNCSDSATDVTISEVDEYNVHKLTFAGMSNAIHELQMEVCSIPDEEESFDSEASISKLCSYIPSAALLCWTDILEMNGGKYALFRVLARLSAHELIFLLECSITVVLDTKENSSSCLLPLAVDIIMCVMCEWFDVGIDFVRHHESDNHDNHTYLRQLWCVLLLIASPRISYLPVSFYDQLDAIVPCFDSEFIQHSLSISPLLLPHMLSGCQMVTYSVFINYVKRAKAMQRSKAMFAGVEQSVLVFQESQLPSLIQNEKDTFLNVKLLVERVLLAASHGESTDSFILLVCFKRLQPIDLMRLETILTLLSTWWIILRLLLPTCSITNESSTRLLTWVLECNSKISECITQNLSLFQDSSSYVSGDICSQLVRTFANLYESLIRVHKYDFLSSVHGIIEAFLVNKPVSSALNSDECLFKIISVAFIALENFIVDVQTIWSDTDHTKSDIRMIIYSIQSVTEFLCNFIYLSTDRIDLSEYFLASYIQPQTYIMTLVSFAQGGMHRLKSNELADSMLLSVETNLMESINNCLTVVYYIALYSKVLSIYSTLDVIFVIHEFIVHYQLYKCDSAASVLWLADQLFKPFTKLIFDKTNLSNIQIDDTLQQLSRVGCPFELDDITTNTFRDLVHHLAEIFYLAYNFPLAANLISDDEVSHTLPLSLTPSSLAVSQMYVLLQLAEKIKALNFSRSNFRSSYLMIYEYESKTTRAIDFKNSIVPYLFHSLKNGHGNPTEFDPMNAHAYFEFVSTAVTEESAKNNLMHSSVSFDLGHHLLKHGGSFPFFGPNCVSSDSDSAEVANRKRLCGAIQLFVDSLAATPFHLATWIGLHKACSDRLQQVTDLIAESFVVLDLPLEVLVYVSFLSVEEMLSAVCDGALMKAVREVRGRALCEVLKHDPIVSETVRLMCQEISVDSSKRKSPNDFTFDADGRCVAKQPRVNGMAVRSITPRDSDNSDDCDVGLDNINATVESDQAYVILLDTMALKNTYTNMVKNCVVMIQLLNEHQSSVNTSSNTTSSIVQMMSSTCFDEDVSAVIESHALTFYNLSLEHPKNSNGRRQLQSESLAAFKTGMYI